MDPRQSAPLSKLKLGLVLLSGLLAPLASLAQQRASGLLCWQEDRPLRWADFQAKTSALPTDSPLFTRSDAHAAPEIKVQGLIDSCGRNNFRVRVVFNQKRAWVRDSTSSSAALLAHEQGHFDICELTARKIRACIARVYGRGEDVFTPEFRQQLQRMVEDEGTLDECYDQETEHGLYKQQQAAWRVRISQELASLSRYKSTASTCYAD